MAKVILFQDTNFKGDALVATEAISHLSSKEMGKKDWNDQTSSLIVVSGNWQIYQNADYGGNYWTVTPDGGPDKDGCYPSYKDWGGNNDQISSIKPV